MSFVLDTSPLESMVTYIAQHGISRDKIPLSNIFADSDYPGMIFRSASVPQFIIVDAAFAVAAAVARDILTRTDAQYVNLNWIFGAAVVLADKVLVASFPDDSSWEMATHQVELGEREEVTQAEQDIRESMQFNWQKEAARTARVPTAKALKTNDLFRLFFELGFKIDSEGAAHSKALEKEIVKVRGSAKQAKVRSPR